MDGKYGEEGERLLFVELEVTFVLDDGALRVAIVRIRRKILLSLGSPS